MNNHVLLTIVELVVDTNCAVNSLCALPAAKAEALFNGLSGVIYVFIITCIIAGADFVPRLRNIDNHRFVQNVI
jgi:hypothetical protein